MSKQLKFLSIILFAFVIIAFTPKLKNENLQNVSEYVSVNQDQEGITFPENVKAIIDAKCMGCHKPGARNEKARKKLQWEKVSKMNNEEQEHLVKELFEVLEDGKMPPKRAVERRPQMKLTDDETKTLLAWVEKEEKRLKGK